MMATPSGTEKKEKKEKKDKILDLVDNFLLGLRRGHINGSNEITSRTVYILRKIINSNQWHNPDELIELVRKYGKLLTSAKPLELAIVNTVRRVLYIIRVAKMDTTEEEPVNLTPRINPTDTTTQLSSSTLRTSNANVSLLTSTGISQAGSTDFSFQSPSTATIGMARRAESRVGILGKSGMIKFTDPSGNGSYSSLTNSGLLSPSGPTLHQNSTLTTSGFHTESDSITQNGSSDNQEFRNAILEDLNLFTLELETAYSQISDHALRHIHANEIILTFGKSLTVEKFLKVAARKRKFEVVVVESSPTYVGQQVAMNLSDPGSEPNSDPIETTLITDTAVFAIMARVNKVIVGTHAVMANGGLIATSGTHLIALAAKHYNVPFVVCTGLYKLCPLYAHDQHTFNELRNPSDVLPDLHSAIFSEVGVKNPAWDYIPPELVSMYITNNGDYSPTYIYRLLSDYYHDEDMDI